MRKLPFLIICVLCCRLLAIQAQQTPAQIREAEWKNYALPQTNFVRQTNADSDLVFRVPADWKQEGTELTFNGPHSARLEVHGTKIPDGYSLNDYFTSVLQGVKDSPAAETLLTRKTQIQNLEAREIFFEIPDVEGEMLRVTAWFVVDGPRAISFNFKVPATHATETEPFFKAVVQSAMLMPSGHKIANQALLSTLKPADPAPLHEVASIVASLNDTVVDREAAVERLTKIFTSTPDIAIDLAFDRRPFVRHAAIKALAKSNNSAKEQLFWSKLNDEEPLVAEAAARSLASAADIVDKTMDHSINGWQSSVVLRIFPFLTKEKRIQLLQRIFNVTAARPPSLPKGDVKIIVDEPKPAKPTKPRDESQTTSMEPPPQVVALVLLSGMSPEEIKTPLERIMVSKNDLLIATALQAANWRGEALPVEPLFKLVGSSNERVSNFAAESFGVSATPADIPRIEALIGKLPATKKSLQDDLTLSIKKIKFRHEFNAAKSPAEKEQVISKALTDSALANFAWLYHCENGVAGCAPGKAFKRDLVVKPFAENLLPAKLRHYTAIPNPAQATQKLYETLNGLQMESPRSQASIALILRSMREMLGNELSAPAEAETLIEFTGIDPNSPIVFSSWTADKALDSTAAAQRTAIVLRVKDRERFGRVVEKYQRTSGSLTDLTDYVAVGTRAIAALPAILPLAAQMIDSRESGKAKRATPHTYSWVGENDLNGIRVKAIEHRLFNTDGKIDGGSTYVAFVGETVILAPDLATIRDLLANASESERRFLAENAEFRKVVERGGDIVYFSDLNAVMADISQETKNFENKGNESGALNFGAASWENSHLITFDESDWAKPLLPFNPKELTAPRDLLPASTIAYFLTNVDVPQGWSSKSMKPIVEEFKDMSKLWAIDIKEVLQELGPECGAVVLELPNLDFEGGAWAAFCKLKSNKLADALNAGKLFSNVGPAKDFARLKSGDNSFVVAVRNGFMIVTNSEKGLATLDGKTSLATTKDYSRAVTKVSGNVVAFGGYNLEAAIAAATKTPVEGLDGQISTLLVSIAGAFHSQNFSATATASSLEARSSVSMDREGRYSIADFGRGKSITFATVDPSGVPITDQNRMSSLVLRLRAKAVGPVENIKDDIKTADQLVEQKSPQEMVVTISARRTPPDKPVELPVKDPQFAADLKATSEFPADDEQVKARALEIAGKDRDAWSVARKLADWTHENLEWKHVVSADPAQTLATREADCSEFSTLFVAMARSLGLPARLVSGLAYSGNSFGGHAWVEVWAGKWIELDPTWGTHFVDATHIRNASSALVTSAALNLIEFEVLETRRSVADFQKTSKALAQHLLKAIPTANKPDIEAAIDLAVLTDEFMGAGSWAKMTDAERDQMWSAYRRVLTEIIIGYGDDRTAKMRLLHLEEKDNYAVATCLFGSSEELLKLKLARRNDLWYLVEVLQSDTGLYAVSETIKPAITSIENMRNGLKKRAGPTEFVRVMLLMNSNPEKAIAIADEALKAKPKDQSLRYVKAMALFRLPLSPEQQNELIKLLRELSDENFSPATYRLANFLNESEDEKESKEAIALYERYTQLEPHDPRGIHSLAAAYDTAGDTVKAEAAYRKTIEMSPNEVRGYLGLSKFLVLQNRIFEVRRVLLAGDKIKDSDFDLFGAVMDSLKGVENDFSFADKLATSEPERMKTSADANLAIGRINRMNERYPTALQYLQTAAQLAPQNTVALMEIAFIHRKQSEWGLTLKFARQALAIDGKDGEAYWELACALARLGRTKEAMSALEKAIEFYPEQADYLEDETDLKAISHLPAFKKLLPPKEKATEKP